MQKTPRKKLSEAFSHIIDEEDYNWLDGNYPQYLAVIESFRFDLDVTPGNLSSYFMSEVGPQRERFIRACAGALRHIRRED